MKGVILLKKSKNVVFQIGLTVFKLKSKVFIQLNTGSMI